MQATKLRSRRLLLLTAVAALALLVGLGIQVVLGCRRYQQHREAMPLLLEQIVRQGTEEADALHLTTGGAPREDEDARQHRLARLAVRKGAVQRGRELELLLLVNPWHEVPEGYQPELARATSWYQVQEDYWVDARCAGALSDMLNDCLRAGHVPIICSAYRTQEYQQELFDNKISRLIDEGVSPGDAPTLAATTVALPGTSEHQLGLAVDLIDEEYPYLDQMQEWTGAQLWLMEHCWDYGFILRYPNGTSDITGIIYEPWHYRYVGVQHAQEIRRLGVTLEEYVALRRGR